MHLFMHDKQLCSEQDMGEVEVDFPFRVSPSEQAIIENDPNPPCSIVLVGRSGTGKNHMCSLQDVGSLACLSQFFH